MLDFQGRLTTYREEPCLRLFGSCRENAVDKLGDLLADAGEAARSSLYLDLAATRILDSASLGVIVFHHNRLRAQGKHLVVLRPSPTCQHLLEITSLNRILEIRDEGPEIEEIARSEGAASEP